MKMSTAAGVAATGQALVCMVQLGDQQSVLQPLFAYAGNDALSFSWRGTSYQSADTRPVSDGAWHHVAVVFNQNYVTFYKDGVAAADVFQMPALQQSEGMFQIGAAARLDGCHQRRAVRHPGVGHRLHPRTDQFVPVRHADRQ